MPKYVRLFSLLAIVTIISLVIVACGGDDEPTPRPTATVQRTTGPVPTASAAPQTPATPVVKRGGTLNFPLLADPTNLDPTNAEYFFGLTVGTHVYSSLVRFNWEEPRDKIVSDLAESWTVSGDGKSYTFKIRSGVKWPDGQPLTSADVKFSLQNQKGGRIAPQYKSIVGIDTPDDTTAILRLEQPRASMLPPLAMHISPIYSQKAIEAGRTRGDLATAAPVGSGPFKLGTFTRGVSLELTANPTYYVPGIPYLDAVKYFIIGDEGTRQSALISGRIDALGLGATDVPQPVVDQMKKTAPNLVAMPFKPLQTDVIAINVNKKPWDDVRVRRAAFLAIDRWTAIKVLPYEDKPAGMPVGLGSWGMTDEQIYKLPGYRQGADFTADRARAKQLLVDAGFAQGIDVTDAIVSPANYDVQLFQYAKDQLAQIGIRVSGGTLSNAEQVARKEKGDFTLNFDSPALDFSDPDGARNTILPGPFVTLADAQLADLFQRQSAETDLSRRRQLVIDMQNRMFEIVSIIPVGTNGTFWMVQPYLSSIGPPFGQWANVRWDRVWLNK